jgi:virginiamycin B lyase
MRKNDTCHLGLVRPFAVLAVTLGLGWPAVAAAQTITEYPLPAGSTGPTVITAGPDGALWFTLDGTNQIGRVTLAGVFTVYPIPTNSSNPFYGIASGSDGALWFTESNANKIGRITTSGVFTEYPLPTAGAQPFAIVAGPDGALWFTEQGCITANCNPIVPAHIGRITTAGAITEYPVTVPSPYDGMQLNGIAAGPDGALWFADNAISLNAGCGIVVPCNLAGVGRISTAGAVTEYTASPPTSPNGFNVPFAITSGPDGALWFTDHVGSIGRMTTTGAATHYNPGGTNLGLGWGITAGPDGALWFTQQGCPSCTPTATPPTIGRITTGGVFAEFPIPSTTAQPIGITASPNGSIWFAESGSGGNKIGTFAVDTLTVSETGTGSGQVTSVPGGINCSPSSNACVAGFIGGTSVTLTASASATSVFQGWTGGGCSGTAPCTLTVGANTTVTASFTPMPSFTLSVAPAGSGAGTVTSNPSGISCGPTCNASFFTGTQVTLTGAAASGSTFAGWSGGGCSGILPCTVTMSANTTVTATFVQDVATNITLYAAVLPLSRSVEVGGTPATAFATILNAGPGNATTCAIAPSTTVTASFVFQTTDPKTNALTGTANTPVDIPAGAGQSFVISFTPNAGFLPTNVAFTFGCANANPAASISGVDTLVLSASSSPVPDIVALVASGDPGYVDIPGATGTGAFAVATANLGAGGQMTVSADTGVANVPVTLTLCQTNTSTGACLATPTPNIVTTIAANATPTFAIFATGSAAVPDLPAINRVFVRFTDAGGALRGATSVAVRTK